MKKPKLFFYSADSEPEFCHSLKYYKRTFSECGATTIKLTEAVPDFKSGFFFCREYDFCGEVSRSDCGSNCKSYAPRNGKNGRCKHSTHCYTFGNREFEFDGKTLIEIKP